MTANQSTGYAGKTVTENTRVTARAVRTDRGDVLTEYEVGGRVYRDVDELEAALRGEAHV